PWPIDGERFAVTVICVSVQVAVVTGVPSSVSWPVPFVAPKPLPETVNPNRLPVVDGREAAYSSGTRFAAVTSAELTGHAARATCVVPGSSSNAPTGTGAVSAGTIRPGKASNS